MCLLLEDGLRVFYPRERGQTHFLERNGILDALLYGAVVRVQALLETR